MPATSCPAAYNCGAIPDGCGGTLTCGSLGGSCAAATDVCGGGGFDVCGPGTCTALTCAAVGADCGSISDGCGSIVSCGSCVSGQLCGAPGAANVCTCSGASCPVLQSVSVSPVGPSVGVGSSLPLTATANYGGGLTRDVTTVCLWSSDDTSTVAVSNSAGHQGDVIGVKVGTAHAAATYRSVASAPDLVTVNPPALSSIQITPVQASIATGAALGYQATGFYADGSHRDVTGTVTWASASPSVATFTSTAGVIKGLATGTSTVTASLGAVTSNTASLSVTAATLVSLSIVPANAIIATGTALQYQAVGIFSDNTTNDLTALVAWSSSAPTAATISTAGRATGTYAGALGTSAVSTITATDPATGISDRTTLTVNAVYLVSITVFPSLPSAAQGTTLQFSAVGTYSDGSQQDITSTGAWSSSDALVATIDGAGLATVQGAGNTTVSAAMGGGLGGATVTGSTVLTGKAVRLTGITVTPVNGASSTIALGTALPLQAIATFSDGSTQDVTTLATWSSATPSVASVSNAAGSAGRVQGISAGSSAVSATVGSTSGSLTVSVVNVYLTSITITAEETLYGNPPGYPSPPAPWYLPINYDLQLHAIGHFGNMAAPDQFTQDITPTVVWAVGNPTINGVLTTVATVSNGFGTQGESTGVANPSGGLGGTAVNATATTHNVLGTTIQGTTNLTVANFFINAGPGFPNGIDVTPAYSTVSAPTLARAQKIQLTAVAGFGFKNQTGVQFSIDVTRQVRWSSGNSIQLTVSPAGLVTDVGSSLAAPVDVHARKQNNFGDTYFVTQ